jgi:hypothetical protein
MNLEKKVGIFVVSRERGNIKRKKGMEDSRARRGQVPCIVLYSTKHLKAVPSSTLLCGKNVFLAFSFLRSVIVRSQPGNEHSVPAQAVLAHDRRRDPLLSYAAAVGAVATVAAASRAGAAVAVTSRRSCHGCGCAPDSTVVAIGTGHEVATHATTACQVRTTL